MIRLPVVPAYRQYPLTNGTRLPTVPAYQWHPLTGRTRSPVTHAYRQYPLTGCSLLLVGFVYPHTSNVCMQRKLLNLMWVRFCRTMCNKKIDYSNKIFIRSINLFNLKNLLNNFKLKIWNVKPENSRCMRDLTYFKPWIIWSVENNRSKIWSPHNQSTTANFVSILHAD